MRTPKSGVFSNCNKCDAVFELTVSQVENHKRTCKACENERNKQRGKFWKDIDRTNWNRSRDGYYQEEDVLKRKAAQMKKYSKSPSLRHKFMARWKTHRAIASGELVKKPCEVCGETKVDAHHDDYSKPLQVRWLCKKHHRELHATHRAAHPKG